jgi:hypothetical protein
MYITKEFLQDIKLHNMYVMFCDYDTLDEVNLKDATGINIGCYDQGVIPIGTFMRTPKKKPIDLEWVMSKVNKDSTFISLTETMKTVVGNNSGIAVYAASYGVGMFRLFGIDKDRLTKIRSFFESNSIEYRNEYSDANYVYRFVISKSKDNIERIKKALS